MPISPTTYWMNQIVLSWWNYLWFLLLRQLPKRNVRKVTKIVSFSLIYFCFSYYFFTFKSNEERVLVQHHLLLFSKLHSLIIVSVFMLLAIFYFFLIIKGLKIIAVTKFSLQEAKSFSTWLLQRQGAFAQNRERWQIELSTSVMERQRLLKLVLGPEEEGCLGQILRVAEAKPRGTAAFPGGTLVGAAAGPEQAGGGRRCEALPVSAAVRGHRVLLPFLGDSPSSFLSSRGRCCSGQEVLDLEGGGLRPKKKAPLPRRERRPRVTAVRWCRSISGYSSWGDNGGLCEMLRCNVLFFTEMWLPRAFRKGAPLTIPKLGYFQCRWLSVVSVSPENKNYFEPSA